MKDTNHESRRGLSLRYIIIMGLTPSKAICDMLSWAIQFIYNFVNIIVGIAMIVVGTTFDEADKQEVATYFLKILIYMIKLKYHRENFHMERRFWNARIGVANC